jgi:queuine tRNA-ribosyltransferase
LWAGVILSNTYHLHLRPGGDIIEKAGGIHKFMNYDGPILTDSGGFQVFSLMDNRKINEEGVVFKNHLNGSKLEFTPEKVIAIQEKIGADIIMSFDECSPIRSNTVMPKPASSVHCAGQSAGKMPIKGKTKLCLESFKEATLKICVITRRKKLVKIDFPGYAIGGTSIGEPKNIFSKMVEQSVKFLPEDNLAILMWRRLD